jgi:signal peptidase I
VAPDDFFSREEQEAENRRRQFADGARQPERLPGTHFTVPEAAPQVIVHTSRAAKAPLVVFVDVPDPINNEQEQTPKEQAATQDVAQTPLQSFVQPLPQGVAQTPLQSFVQTPSQDVPQPLSQNVAQPLLQDVAQPLPQSIAQSPLHGGAQVPRQDTVQEQPQTQEDIQKKVLRQALNREQIREQILQNSQALKAMPTSLNDRVKAAAAGTTDPSHPNVSTVTGTTDPSRSNISAGAEPLSRNGLEPFPTMRSHSSEPVGMTDPGRSNVSAVAESPSYERRPVTPITLPPVAVSVPAQATPSPGSELSTVIADSSIIPAASAPVPVRPMSIVIDANKPRSSGAFAMEPLEVNEDWARDFESARPSRISRIKERLSRKDRQEQLSDSESRAANIKHVIFVALRDVAIVVALFAILLQFFSPTVVNEHSMENTFVEKDILFIANKAYWFGEPNYNDIIIFNDNGEEGNKKLVKRVIGLPGDTILISGNKVFRNGVALDEPYTKDGQTSGPFGTITVPEDCYYVLGDNREVSRDSRSEDIGFVSKDQLAGKVIFRLFPLNRFGFY